MEVYERNHQNSWTALAFPLSFALLSHTNNSSNLYCLIDQPRGDVSTTHPRRICTMLFFTHLSRVLLSPTLFLWLNGEFISLTQNTSLYCSRRQRKKSKWLSSFIGGAWKKNQFFWGLRVRAKRNLSPHWNANQLWCSLLKRLCGKEGKKVVMITFGKSSDWCTDILR